MKNLSRRSLLFGTLLSPLLSLLPRQASGTTFWGRYSNGVWVTPRMPYEINIDLKYLHQGRKDIFKRFMEVLANEDGTAYSLLKKELSIPIINGPIQEEMLCLINFYEGLDIHIPSEAKRMLVTRNSQGYWVQYLFDNGNALMRKIG